MATESKGILGRMAKMLRNQNAEATDWNSLDAQGASKTEPYSKAALKKMIERRRHNDYVRKREFEMLRKLRNRAKGGKDDSSMRPSFFASSMNTRTKEHSQETIQKINQIEAQMSMQWWKNKHGVGGLKGAGGKSRAMAPTAPTPLEQPSDPSENLPFPSAEQAQKLAKERARQQALQQNNKVASPPVSTQTAPPLQPRSASVPAQQPRQPVAGGASEAPTRPTPFPQTPVSPVAAPVAKQAAQTPPTTNKQKLQTTVANHAPSELPSNFSPSHLFIQEAEEALHDPDLEEAAILFANGDDESAEATLKEAIADDAPKAMDENAWLTLIDLYRATGNKESYEATTLDFVVKFNRSAPQWFSLPDLTTPEAEQKDIEEDDAEKKHDWKSPSKMTQTSVATLKAALQKRPQPWILDWTPISSIADDAVEPLIEVFQEWAASSCELHFIAARSLAMVMAAQTTVNDTNIDQKWWDLRMAHARIIADQEEFENLALDFCITYEVSPPSWIAISHDYRDLDHKAEAPKVQISNTVLDSVITTTNKLHDATAQDTKELAGIELSGVILGDASEVLSTIEERRGNHDVLVIACDKLVRVDFSGAGAILNWVINMHGQGVLVQFSNLHRLLSSLFNVLGINEHAKVLPRKD